MTYRRVAIAVASAALLLLGSCAGARRLMNGPKIPAASVVETTFSGMTWEETTIEVEVLVQNPYQVPIAVVGADFTLRVDGTEVLEGQTDGRGMVPAKGEARYLVALPVSYTHLMESWSRMRRGESLPWVAWLGIRCDCPHGVGMIRTPVKAVGTLSIPAAPVVTLTGLRWEDADAERFTAAVGVEVGNPNAFPIKVVGLDYELELVGRRAGQASSVAATPVAPAALGRLEVEAEIARREVGTATLTRLAKEGAGYGLTGVLSIQTPWGFFQTPFTARGLTE
jgi:LEA14-like dessication related protein